VEPTQGLRAFGRAYAAWLTSPEWFRQNLWKQFGAASLRDWLHPPEGTAVFEGWDAEDLIAMARMWQAGNVGTVAGAGDYRKALEGIIARVLIIRMYPGALFFLSEMSQEEFLLRQHHPLFLLESSALETCLGSNNSKSLPEEIIITANSPLTYSQSDRSIFPA
jgi:homoserine O-acetyltransferase